MQALPAVEMDVVAARRGDRAAYARLVDAHRSLVASLALALTRDVAASEDLAQEVFLDAWRRLGQLRNPGSFLPWLRQLTRYRASHARAREVRRRTEQLLDALLDSVADPRPSDVERLVSEEEQSALAAALDALPAETREVVTLYYREGQSTEQVAQLLSLRPEAVRQRLARARHRLREEVLGRLGEVVERTRPGERFTAAVLAALPVTLAPAAARAGATAGVSGALAKLAALGAGAFLGAGLGLAGGLSGVAHFTAHERRAARTDAERDAAARLGWQMAGSVVFFVPAYVAALLYTRGWCLPVLAQALFVVLLAVQTLLLAPRLRAPRLAWAKAHDPERYARELRRQRRAPLWMAFGAAWHLPPALILIHLRPFWG
jgi:RNA polymerase sigma factor (sigma-70 family)